MNIPWTVFLIFTARVYGQHRRVGGEAADFGTEQSRETVKAGLSRGTTDLAAAPAPRGESRVSRPGGDAALQGQQI